MRNSAATLVMRCATLLVALAACSPATGPRRAQRILDTLARMGPEGHGERRLADLDNDADGRITRDDVRAVEALSRRWQRALAERGLALDPRVKLYHGKTKDLAPAVAIASYNPEAIDLVSNDALIALAVETRWMAAQAMLAVGRKAGTAPFGGVLVEHVPGYHADAMEPAQVCAAVEQVDATPYREAGVQAPAVMFDLDSTLWPGNVMDPFLAVLVEERLPRPEANTKLAAFLKTVPGIDAAQVEGNDVVANARLLLERSTDAKLPAEHKISTKDAFYNIVALLAGMRVEDAEKAARRVYEGGSSFYPPWRTHLFADRDGCSMRRIIETLKRRGMRVVLLSAGLDVLSWAAADAL
ncbi:MAG: haloacid dehalogenase-like hydrolase, partial [Deltaproteobacteria bacterium]|nr:haloacid dehalogenase-like hydrolase [Deltaproteobacteria bacterium]